MTEEDRDCVIDACEMQRLTIISTNSLIQMDFSILPCKFDFDLYKFEFIQIHFFTFHAFFSFAKRGQLSLRRQATCLEVEQIKWELAIQENCRDKWSKLNGNLHTGKLPRQTTYSEVEQIKWELAYRKRSKRFYCFKVIFFLRKKMKLGLHVLFLFCNSLSSYSFVDS